MVFRSVTSHNFPKRPFGGGPLGCRSISSRYRADIEPISSLAPNKHLSNTHWAHIHGFLHAELAHICPTCPLRPEILPGPIRIVIMAMVVAGAGAAGPCQQGHLYALRVGQTLLLVTCDGHGRFLWELRRWYYRDAMAPPIKKLYHRSRTSQEAGESDQNNLHCIDRQGPYTSAITFASCS